jgi:hypothetical protein
VAQDRDRWQTLVNLVMNLRVLAPRSLVSQCIDLLKCTLTSLNV